MKSRSIPNETEVDPVKDFLVKKRAAVAMPYDSGRTLVEILLGLMPTSLPSVNGKPRSLVLSNSRPAELISIVTCRSDSLFLPGWKVTVKKFGSREDAFVPLPFAVTCTDAPVDLRLPDGVVAVPSLKKGSMSCGLSTLFCKA